MSLSQVRQYFRDRLNAVDSSFKEHEDGFNRENIPSTLLNKSFFIDLGDVSSQPLSDLHIQDLMATQVFLHFKGYNNIQSKIDEAYDLAHTFRIECIKPINAMTGTNIKNVVCDNINVDHIETNDNTVIVTLDFTVRLLFNPN